MAGSDERPRGGELNTAISNAVVQTLARYTGRGATSARTIMGPDWVFVTLTDTLTHGERSLAESGRAKSVRNHRREYQDLMRDDFVAAVESLTGREVKAFLSDSHIDPDVSVEAFHLSPVID